VGSHNAEEILNKIPAVTVTHMRPTYFYYNLYFFIQQIRTEGVITANYGADKIVLVSPLDIAAAVAEELVSTPGRNTVRYVASDEHTGSDIARILGEAIGKPGLTWTVTTDEQMRQRYEAIGASPRNAKGLVDMLASLRNGLMGEDYNRHQPATLGKVKLTDFAREFAGVYGQN
jgi:uncharacterized protein YbjT (DUF2867 family)